jgi:hypothetical protein
VVLENSPKFKDTIAQKHPGEGPVRKNLEDIALAAIRFSDKLIPLAAALFADANLLARHCQILQESGGGSKDVFDLIAAYVSEEQQIGRINREAVPLAVGALLLGPYLFIGISPAGDGQESVANE